MVLHFCAAVMLESGNQMSGARHPGIWRCNNLFRLNAALTIGDLDDEGLFLTLGGFWHLAWMDWRKDLQIFGAGRNSRNKACACRGLETKCELSDETIKL